MLRSRTHTSNMTRSCAGGAILSLLLLSMSVTAGTTIRVTETGSDLADGGTWGTAASLQHALAIAAVGDEIWVQAGTYKPGTTRASTFQLTASVGVYGGFGTGAETLRSQRDWTANVTILSGDVNEGDADADCYHVVSVTTGANNATLDGFTIRDGKANAGNSRGSGFYCYDVADIVLANCILTNNSVNGFGGALTCESSTLSITDCVIQDNQQTTWGGSGGGAHFYSGRGGVYPTITRTLFLNNSSAYRGGGVLVSSCTATFNECVFSGNTSAGDLGGGGYVTASDAAFNNCVFTGNRANGGAGGALYIDGSSGTKLTNCTLTGNYANSSGGAVYAGNYSPGFKNCILWGNSSPAGNEVAGASGTWFAGCDIQGGVPAGLTDSGNNIAIDPKFVDISQPAGPDGVWRTADDGLRVDAAAKSLCIDRGVSIGVTLTNDILGNARFQGATLDVGAYENSSTGLAASPIIYVNAGVVGGSDNGSSWADAFSKLDDALTVASSSSEIWVAAGTYIPSSTRTDSFQLKTGVAVYGGFNGTELARDDRDWTANLTTLSGDVGAAGNQSDNCYHVVKGAEGASLDGLTITGGNANNTAWDNDKYGGGIYCYGVAISLANCIIKNNSSYLDGGGLYTAYAAATVSDCVFQSNTSTNQHGGGAFNYTGKSGNYQSYARCLFVGNSAVGGGGGGLCLYAVATPVADCVFTGNSASGGGGLNLYSSGGSTIRNCVFAGNNAGSAGGGYQSDNGTPELTNCTFTGNSASTYGGAYSAGGAPVAKNCIFWNDTAPQGKEVWGGGTFSYCNVEGGVPYGFVDNGNNIAVEPKFINAALPAGADGIWRTADDGLRLDAAAKSLCIDRGTDAIVPATDILGNAREQNAHVDMGAYENAAAGVVASNPLYVDGNVAGGNHDGSLWANAFSTLQEALAIATSGGDIYVAAGTYKPGTVREDTFQMKTGVNVYGGFNSGDAWGARDPATKVAILSGDIGAAGSGDNSYHIARAAHGARLDGFTLTGGNASGLWAHDQYGGAIHCYAVNMAIANCIFKDNLAYYGAAIYSLSCDTAISDCLFQNNIVGGTGGALFVSGTKTGQPSVVRSLFLANAANGVEAGGGGAYFDGCNAVVDKCVFSGNSAPNGYGGGVRVANWSPKFTNCVFVNNTARDAGAMHNDSTGTEINGCTIVNNTATRYAGALGCGGSPVIKNSILWNNSAPTGRVIYWATPTFSSCDIQGGVPSSATDGGNNIATDPKFININAPAGTDGIWRTADDGLALATGSICIGRGTLAGAPGDDILAVSRPQGIGVDMGAYENVPGTEVTTPGPVIYVKWNATGTNNGSTWDNAFTDLTIALAFSDAISANEIWVAKGTYKPGTARNDSFLLKTGVALYGGFAGTETLRTERDWITNPTILSGDVGVSGSSSDNSYHVIVAANGATLDGFTVTGGRADGSDDPEKDGGGIYAYNVTMALANCVFSSNSAMDDGGGAYFVSPGGMNSTITNCTFFACSAGSRGGGFWHNNSSASFTDCTFQSCSATNYGGGIASFGNRAGNSPTFLRCSFLGNTAGWHPGGGGMLNQDGCSPQITLCTFKDNSCTGYGGGMTNFNSCNPTVSRCVFVNNMASYGGGIYTNGGWMGASYTNCVIVGNRASTDGGAMLTQMHSSTITLFNCTVTKNAASSNSGGITLWELWGGDTFALKNTIVWGNTAATNPNLYENSPGGLIVDYSDIQGGWAGTSNLDVDPQFVNATVPPGADNTWRTSDDGLIPTNPALRAAGTASGAPAIDLMGTARPQPVTDTNPDIGAYEVLFVAMNQSVTVLEGSTNNPVTLQAYEAGGAALTYEIVSGPTHGTLDSLLPGPAARTYTPTGGYSGPDQFTFRAKNGPVNSNVATVSIAVTPLNNAPTFVTTIPDQAINQGASCGPLAFSINDVETPLADLALSKATSNPALVPLTGIVFGGSDGSRTVTVTPAPDQYGTATITVTVTDGGGKTASDAFVLSVNAKPTIDNIPDQLTLKNVAKGPITFGISDPDGSADVLVLAATSDNQTLVPDGNVALGGTGANRTITLTPAWNKVSEFVDPANITITVTDAAGAATSDTFVLTVNEAPTISHSFPNPTTAEDIAVGPLQVTVNDLETPAGDLVLSAASDNTTLVPAGNVTFGGSGTDRTVTVTPAANQSGSATITLTVTDGAGSTASDTFVVNVSAVNDLPTITAVGNHSVDQSQTAGPYPFTIGDVETAVGSLTVTADSTNIALVPVANIALGGTGAGRDVTLTPVAGRTGSSTVTLTVTDGNGAAASTSFTLTVNPVNHAPTISDITDKSTPEDTASGPHAFTIGDDLTLVDNLTLTATSTNTTLVPNGNIALGRNGANCTVTVTPAANQSGSTTITITVTDGGGLSAGDSFNLTVTPVNNPPALSTIGDQTTNENTVGGPYPFTIGDIDTPIANLTLSAQSSNVVLVPVANVSFGGSGTGRTITITPTVNQFGSASITVTVNDGSGGTASTAFTFTVTQVNMAPTISAITDKTTLEDTPSGPHAFTVGDDLTPVANLTLSAASSNTTVVPVAGIAFGGSGANRTVTVTPAANQSGSSTITITVTDGGSLMASTSFTLTVTAANDPPTISAVGNQAVDENTVGGPYPFTVNDIETAPASLTVSAESSNAALVPLSGIVLGGSGTGRTITITPAHNQVGTSTITLTVTDANGATASGAFVFTVNRVNQPPTISSIANATTEENTVTAPLLFTVGDDQTPPGDLKLSAASNNTTLVPVANIVFGGSGPNRSVIVTPALNQSGTATITVTVVDAENLPASAAFVLTVNHAANHQPELASGPRVAPNPAEVGREISFAAAASDPDNDPLDYSWDMGDGSPVVAGASGTHTYAAAGTYSVVVMVRDGKGAIVTGTVGLTVNPSTGGGGGVVVSGDTDGDGFADEVETALGSDPNSASDIPPGAAKATKVGTLSVAKLGIKLNFAKPAGNDAIGLSGMLLIPDGFQVGGQKVIVDIGGVVKSFTLDPKGKSPKGNDSFAVAVKAGKTGTPLQVAKFAVKLSKGSFATVLADDGLVNATTSASVTVPVTVIFNGEVLQKAVRQSYKASAGKGGATK